MATTFNSGPLDRQSNRSTLSVGIKTAATTPQLQALVDAVDGIIIGSEASGTKVVSTPVDVGVSQPPANKDANRGNKWLFRAQDSVNGKIFTHEIGCADNALLASADGDYIDLTGTEGAALKTAFDAVYESPYGNAGVLLSVQQVNRAVS